MGSGVLCKWAMSFIKFSSCSPNQNQIEFDVRALPRSHKCTHFSYYLNSDAHMPKWLCHEEWEFHCRLWKKWSNTKEKRRSSCWTTKTTAMRLNIMENCETSRTVHSAAVKGFLYDKIWKSLKNIFFQPIYVALIVNQPEFFPFFYQLSTSYSIERYLEFMNSFIQILLMLVLFVSFQKCLKRKTFHHHS